MDRETKISNEILKRLLGSYNLNHIRVFLKVLNKSISKSYAMMKTEMIDEDMLVDYGALEIEINYQDIKKEYGRKIGREEIVTFIEDMASIKLSYKDIKKGKKIIKTVCPFSSIEYCEDDDKFTFYLNESEIELLILINKKYTILKLEDVNKITSKYEFAIYIWYNMYKGLGQIEFTIEEIKEFLYTGGSTYDTLKYLRKAIKTVNEKLGYEIIETDKKRGRNIVKVKYSW